MYNFKFLYTCSFISIVNLFNIINDDKIEQIIPVEIIINGNLIYNWL